MIQALSSKARGVLAAPQARSVSRFAAVERQAKYLRRTQAEKNLGDALRSTGEAPGAPLDWHKFAPGQPCPVPYQAMMGSMQVVNQWHLRCGNFRRLENKLRVFRIEKPYGCDPLLRGMIPRRSDPLLVAGTGGTVGGISVTVRRPHCSDMILRMIAVGWKRRVYEMILPIGTLVVPGPGLRWKGEIGDSLRVRHPALDAGELSNADYLRELLVAGPIAKECMVDSVQVDETGRFLSGSGWVQESAQPDHEHVRDLSGSMPREPC